MGDTLFGKPYGLTHEEMLKAHHVLTAIATAKKTPYQLDLEVKDRKPDIVPKVGDKVKIKSREWYEKWKGSEWWVSFSSTDCCFVKDMEKLCGKTFAVTSVEDTEDGGRWRLGFQGYYFVPEMFEEVYPQKSSKEEKCAKAFDSLTEAAKELERSLRTTPRCESLIMPKADVSAIPAINAIQGIGISTDWSKAVLNAPAVITLPNDFSSRECTQVDIEHLRFKWGLNKEPELQTIKKHRFIKLKKL